MEKLAQCNEENICSREFKYDNIKFILIFLVVFGHIIENVEKFNIVYLIIYSFHMSTFVFISGYFSKGSKKAIIKPFCIYIIFQTLYFFIYKFTLNENIILNYLQPIWILWYIFALTIWNCLVLILKYLKIKKVKNIYLIIMLTFIISLICGYIDRIGYYLSLSRIITFFPFFLIGYFSKNNNIKILKKDEKNNKIKILAYSVAILVCIIYFISIPNINSIWFYGSYSYRNAGYNIIFKIMSSLFSLCIIFIFNNLISNKKTLISVVGKDTLFIYLLHGLIIKIFISYINDILDTNNFIFSIIIALVFTIIIIIRNRDNGDIHTQDNRKNILLFEK